MLLQLSSTVNTKDGEADRAITQFLSSRREGLSSTTIDFYKAYLVRSVPQLGLTPTPSAVNALLNSLSCSSGGKHAYFRALRVFYRWVYSPRSGLDMRGRTNPMEWVDAPKVPKLILPSLSREQVEVLISKARNIRDKAVIALLAESGLRLSELAGLGESDIDWHTRTVRVLGKGNKEGYAPFGELSERYLREWLVRHEANGNIWGVNGNGIKTMLRRLEAATGLPCNPHTFRRTFACLLRKAGVDTMTIKDLGRWESLEMVQRYTRSVRFEDNLRFYKAPLS
ncbi:MAG: tyrosine-type recombinase/integrase [Chloroflexi bacterium]|nr:tyrosine-type recombinase/integrase [Chloroflexota bacterium]